MKIVLTILALLWVLPTALAFEQHTVSLRRELTGDGDIDAEDDHAPIAEEPSCFSGESHVQVLGKGSVAMKDLQIGECVLTSHNYQPVYAFAHYEPKSTGTFLRLTDQLEMTGEHLVYVKDKKHPVRADSVKVGDALQGGTTVTKITTVKRQGLYAPLTEDGTVVVGGVQASSYSALQDNPEQFLVMQNGYVLPLSHHNLVHYTLAPFRMICLGMPTLCPSTTTNGYPYYVEQGLNLGQKVNKEMHSWQQLLVAMVFALVFGPLVIAEYLIGPSMVPGVLLFAVSSFVMNTLMLRIHGVTSMKKTKGWKQEQIWKSNFIARKFEWS